MASNWNVAQVSEVGSLGPDVIVVTGGIVSTVQVHPVGADRLPAASSAESRSVCWPSARFVSEVTPEHRLFMNKPWTWFCPSSAHE